MNKKNYIVLVFVMDTSLQMRDWREEEEEKKEKTNEVTMTNDVNDDPVCLCMV